MNGTGRYTVTADSSVLGAHCDAYEHRYLRVAYQDHDAGIFDVDIGLSLSFRSVPSVIE